MDRIEKAWREWRAKTPYWINMKQIFEQAYTAGYSQALRDRDQVKYYQEDPDMVNNVQV